MLDALEVLHGLVLEDGRAWGVAAVDWQVADARAVLDLDGPRMHFLTRPRGGSKTTDLAAVAIALLLAQAPPRSRSYAIAVDADQAGLLLDAIGGFIARTDGLANLLVLEARRVVVRSNDATLEVLPADAASAWGLKPWLMIVDERAQWPETPMHRHLWDAIVSAMPKVPTSRLVVLTSAGAPNHGSYKILQRAREAETWRVNEVSGPVPWLSEADLDEARAQLIPSQYARLMENRWTVADDVLVTPEDLAAAVTLDGPLDPEPGVRYVVGLDVGVRNDRTAVAVEHLKVDGESRRVVLDRLVVFAGTRADPVRLGQVEATVLDLSRRYNGARVVTDPWQAIQMAQSLRKAGVSVEEFTFSSSSVGRLAVTLATLLRNREIDLPADEELIAELGRVQLRETSPGVVRMDHAHGQHDDRAIALALAAECLVSAPAAVPLVAPIVFYQSNPFSFGGHPDARGMHS